MKQQEPNPTHDQATQATMNVLAKLQKRLPNIEAEYYVTLDPNARGEGKSGFAGYLILPVWSVKAILKELA